MHDNPRPLDRSCLRRRNGEHLRHCYGSSEAVHHSYRTCSGDERLTRWFCSLLHAPRAFDNFVGYPNRRIDIHICAEVDGGRHCHFFEGSLLRLWLTRWFRQGLGSCEQKRRRWYWKGFGSSPPLLAGVRGTSRGCKEVIGAHKERRFRSGPTEVQDGGSRQRRGIFPEIRQVGDCHHLRDREYRHHFRPSVGFVFCS